MKFRLYLILILSWCLIFMGGLFINRTTLENPRAFTGNGYGGPIQMHMAMSDTGTITFVDVKQHHETSSYISHLEAFLKQFSGRPTQNPLILGKDIDAISGATITSKAITDAVRQKRDSIMKIKNPQQTASFQLSRIIIPLFLTLTAIAAFALRHNPLRWAVLLGGMVYFGIIHHSMLSILQITQAGLGFSPGFTENTFWWMLLGISFLSALFIGRIYCGYLCPFAAIQEILFFLKIRRSTTAPVITPAIDQQSRIIKYILLFLIMGLALLFNSSAAGNIEPFITLFSGHGSKLAWVFLALMLSLAVFSFRFWCQYLCPVGALTGLASIFSLYKIKPNSACTACGTCTKVCPTQAITPDAEHIPQIDTAECIACAKCLRACPAHALHIQGPGHVQK
ncbi:MAG: FMN-binding protein [Candidatus Omnitrophota bacterium]